MSLENKWFRAIIPAVLLQISTGSIYCFSTFKQLISQQINCSDSLVGWCFSLAIFFLGFGAAFTGKKVEKDIHKSSLIAAILFCIGYLGSGLVLSSSLTGISALILLYILYGAVLGTSLGISYITPVKTLMCWMPNNKGLAASISIMSFGLAKTIATPIMEWLQTNFGLNVMFIAIGSIYTFMMFIGHILLKKPEGHIEEQVDTSFKAQFVLAKELFTNKTFLLVWFIFFLSISNGLMLIPFEKQVVTTYALNFSKAKLALLVAIVPSISALFNAFGRIGFATMTDYMKNKSKIYSVIFMLSVVFIAIALFYPASTAMMAISLVIPMIMVVNMDYGAGFSCLPAVLVQKFGMERISSIHGMMLSAWAIAGLTGNNLSQFILNKFSGEYGYVFEAMAVLYLFGFWLSRKLESVHD